MGRKHFGDNISQVQTKKKDVSQGHQVLSSSPSASQNETTTTTTTTIGIDLGTSNCAAAIWDSTRGHPKWMRLNRLAEPQQSNSSKPGRVVPSTVLFTTRDAANQMEQFWSSSSSSVKGSLPWLQNVTTILKHKYQTTAKRSDHQNQLADQKNSGAKRTDDGRSTRPEEEPMWAIVGYSAQWILDVAFASDESATTQSNFPFSAQEVSSAFVSSAKRAIVSHHQHDTKTRKDTSSLSLRQDRSSIPLHTSMDANGTVLMDIQPLGSNRPIQVSPLHIMAILLQSLCSAAQDYLHGVLREKHLAVPGDTWRIGSQCVIGVPAHFDQTQRHQVLESARWAGLDDASLLTESTAAAMAYGLFVASSSNTTTKEDTTLAPKKSILVFDMGGGTTDITIAELKSSSDDDTGTTEGPFSVKATAGNSQLGGDDMDRAIAQSYVLSSTTNQTTTDIHSLSDYEWRRLLRNCKQAKEHLCAKILEQDASRRRNGDDTPKDLSTIEESIEFQGHVYKLTADQLQAALEEFMVQVNDLVELSLTRYADSLTGQQQRQPNEAAEIHEVILVGGATRVFCIRDYLKGIFLGRTHSPQELCVSVHPMAAVAQGTAIQAAIQSRLIPLHELQSAMMLDTVPHDIGVRLSSSSSSSPPTGTTKRHDDNNDSFVCLIPRGTTLEATGSAWFQLAHIRQQGVTVHAVERIAEFPSGKETLVDLGIFNFLLYRPSSRRLEELEQDGGRFIQIEMTLKETGEFSVAVVDENDPEQTQRRRRKQQEQQQQLQKEQTPSRRSKRSKQTDSSESQYYLLHEDDTGPNTTGDEYDQEAMPVEQLLLVAACILLFFLYLGLKVLFQDTRSVEWTTNEL